MFVYIYDLKIRGKKPYNNLKRNFYYSLNKLSTKFKRKTKSVIVIEKEYEKDFDKFFTQWKSFIELYKLETDKIEEVFTVNLQ